MSSHHRPSPSPFFALAALLATVLAVLIFAAGPAAAVQASLEPLRSGIAYYPPYDDPTPTPTLTPTPTPTPTRVPDGPAPVITSIDPDHGENDAFTWVRVNGSQFRGAPTVYIGDTALGDVSRVNGNLILAGAPPHLRAGAHTVRVCNPDGTCGILPDGFTVIGADPILNNIVPDQGYNDTPNDVALFGFKLQDGLIVTVGDQLLEDIAWVNGTQVQGVVPAGMAAGVYDVTVRNPGNPNASTLADAYTVFDAARDDFSASAEDFWVAPATIRQGDTVQLGLNVHRRGGKSTMMVEVAFYRLDAARTYQEIGRATTPPMPPGAHEVDTAFIWWDTSAEAENVQIAAVIDPDAELPETTRENNYVERFFTLLPPIMDEEPPVINDLRVNDGAEATADPNVVVTIDASDTGGSGVASMYLVEREFNSSARQWVAIQSTGWVPFQSPFPFRLTDRGGVRYIQAWVSDGAGNIAEGTVKTRIDYLPPADAVQAGQVRIYRRAVTAGQVVHARLEVVSGDADLYVWRPDGGQSWVSNYAGTATDEVVFTAPMSGDYQFEVFGFQSSTYRLTIDSAESRGATVSERSYLAPDKSARTQPVIDPLDEPEGRAALPMAPITISPTSIFLPAVQR